MNIRIGQKLSLLVLLALLLTAVSIPGCNVANQENSIDLEGTIVFSMIPEDSDQWQLFSINPDGSGLEQLTYKNSSTDISDEDLTDGDIHGYNPSFNSDRSKILMNVSGGIGPDPIIAYVELDGGFVWSVGSIASDTDVLLTGNNPRWTPDESKIIYWGSHLLNNPAIYDPSIEEITYLGYEFPDDIFENKTMYGPVYPSYSPDGSRIVFKESNDIYVSDTDGGNLRQITNSDEREIFYNPVWHPDNHTVAVRLSDAYYEANRGLYQIDVETGNVELLVSDNKSFLIPHAWSKDGNYILAIGRLKGEDLFELKIFDIDKNELIQVYTSESRIRGADMFLELEN